jgi:hypothetical protein
MLLCSMLVLAGFVYVLAHMPPIFRELQETAPGTIEVPAELTKEDTLGYR